MTIHRRRSSKRISDAGTPISGYVSYENGQRFREIASELGVSVSSLLDHVVDNYIKSFDPAAYKLTRGRKFDEPSSEPEPEPNQIRQCDMCGEIHEFDSQGNPVIDSNKLSSDAAIMRQQFKDWRLKHGIPEPPKPKDQVTESLRDAIDKSLSKGKTSEPSQE